MTKRSVLFFCLSLCSVFAGEELPRVELPSPELRKDFKLAPHYQKAVLLRGFPIVGSENVADEALLEAAIIVRRMLSQRPDVLDKLAENKIRLGIMAVEERTCDLPEHADLEPASFWNRRARGLGATRERPVVSCGEENLLNHPGDPYDSESIMVHEFAHAIHLMAVNDLDKTFDQRLEQTYRQALAQGLWKGNYAGSNSREYFAEGVQSWFDTNRENDGIHNHVNTREELIAYDPALADLIQEVFGSNDWRYRRADHLDRKEESHLKAIEWENLTPFYWSKSEQGQYEKITQGGVLREDWRAILAEGSPKAPN